MTRCHRLPSSRDALAAIIGLPYVPGRAAPSQADVYVLVDGDDTYDATSAPAMVRTLIETQLDMVNGKRISEIQAAYRRGHRFGNALLSTLVSAIFGKRFTDILSGYRVLSRRF